MKILVIGNGGREHALLWKLRQDAPDADLFVTRGNGGTAGLATPVPLDPGDAPALAVWAEQRRVDLTVVGPEGPLAEGIVDVFNRHGLHAFGPTRAAAAIEASKAFAKNLMRRAGVPTAGYETFDDLASAEHYIQSHPVPMVVKASGLAAGKGAVVCETHDDALAAARSMLGAGTFGAAGQRVVIEEFMHGEELSVFALTDGHDVLLLPTAQDHKRLGEGDTGPNTGGMGAYAPVSIVDDALLDRVRRRILLPTLAALREEKRPFRGLLYAGLMLTEEGPKVVEYNARFGDPETQAVLPLVASSLLEPLLAIARGERLPRGAALELRQACALTTVLAAGGYPGSFERGHALSIPETLGEATAGAAGDVAADTLVFHAGTRREADGRLVTSGGRVLAVTGVGATLAEAAERSRAGARAIVFRDRYFRSDIGWRELERHAGAP
jgi:phosphoribosylamine---glycine ligase